uniref:DUF2780 domain-containing protein n=1 Tax=Thaumasiovibrio occultus TaxID=1891184 RepID=UPI000B35D273|nr:DUF2780 domain-containing protein [Thaumasiovibrio occultus]
MLITQRVLRTDVRTGLKSLSIIVLVSSPLISPSLFADDPEFEALFGGEPYDTQAFIDNTQTALLGSEALDSPLTGLIVERLGMRPLQAAGSAGAMLALANDLPAEQLTELRSLIPEFNSLTHLATSLNTPLTAELATSEQASDELVTETMLMLDLDPKMLSLLSPMLLRHLAEQGANEDLLAELNTRWQR